MRSAKFWLAFVDMLLVNLLLFISVVAIVFQEQEQKKSKKDFIEKAEFVLTAEWDWNDNRRNDDVDMYLQDPNENIIYYRNMSKGVCHLERDDRGTLGDTSDDIEIEENFEKILIRGNVSGEYIYNLHMFSKSTDKETTVKWKIEKVNPYKVIATNKVVLNDVGDEKTAVRFTIDAEGNVTDINYLPKQFVYSAKSSGEDYGL